MSPALLRRYRAERLLRRDFERVRGQVLASVRANLGARGIVLDLGDLEVAYSQAWQGLYASLIEGQEIDNPTGWLTTVCFRRAIDEYRQRSSERQRLEGSVSELEGRVEPDLAGALDDRVKLRQTFEALGQGLSAREQQAASLCYLQGLSRGQAAERMGISEARMRKLMEGHGPGRPGVAGKVDALLATVHGGGWCEQQASLMRGLAYGVHDPEGERYRLALLHLRECPACRAYVLSLRGLAAVLPPLALPWVPGMAGVGGALGGGAGAGAGAAGAGAGGSLPLGGSLGVKLATGCLLVVGLGGGCVALIAGPAHSGHGVFRGHDLARGPGGQPPGSAPGPRVALARRSVPRRASGRTASHPRSARAATGASTAGQAQRELGFERPSESQARSPAAPGGSTSPRGAGGEFGAG
jgi:RNA polymerase sigma factor (sigma-70 family)